VEAINHAKQQRPIVVAVNKIDKPKQILPVSERAFRARHHFGGMGWPQYLCRGLGKEALGIEHLLEMILLQAEMMELKANPLRKGKEPSLKQGSIKGESCCYTPRGRPVH